MHGPLTQILMDTVVFVPASAQSDRSQVAGGSEQAARGPPRPIYPEPRAVRARARPRRIAPSPATPPSQPLSPLAHTHTSPPPLPRPSPLYARRSRGGASALDAQVDALLLERLARDIARHANRRERRQHAHPQQQIVACEAGDERGCHATVAGRRLRCEVARAAEATAGSGPSLRRRHSEVRGRAL